MATAEELNKQKKNADALRQEADRAAADQKTLLKRHGAELEKQIVMLREEKTRNDAEISKLA